MRLTTSGPFVVVSCLLAAIGCTGDADMAGKEPDTAVAGAAVAQSDSTLANAARQEEPSAPISRESHPLPTSARRIAEVAWKERWKRGGRRQDTVLRAPIFVAADSARVYVIDRDPMAVVAFRADDGSVVWHSDTLVHPSFDFLRDVAIRPNGEVVLLDDNATLHRVSPNGNWIAAIHLGALGPAHSLCVPDDASLLIYTIDEHRPFVRIDTLGQVLERYPMPWEDLEGAPAVATQSRLASAPGGRCAVALTLGRGFATIRRSNVLTRQRYIEEGELPDIVPEAVVINGIPTKRVRRPPGHPAAARSVAVGDSTIVVLFGGRTADWSRILDSYDLETGEYRESWRLPFSTDAVTVNGKTVFLLGTSAGYPTLAALTK